MLLFLGAFARRASKFNIAAESRLKLYMNTNTFEELPEDLDDDEELPPPKPWLRYYSDVEGQIQCDESSEAWVYFAMTALFVGIAVTIFYYTSFGDPRDDVLIYLIRSVFPVIALGCLILAMRAHIRMKKFGISTFQIKNERGILGQDLSGTIITSTEIRPRGDFKVSLECVEKKVTSAGNKSSTRHVILSKEKTQISANSVSSRIGIPVKFAIPTHLPPSNPLEGNGQICWILRIAAATPVLNYRAAFVVPVFPKDAYTRGH